MKNKKVIIIVVLAIVLVGVVVYGTNKYMKRRKAEKLVNQILDVQGQIITQGTGTTENIIGGALNVFNKVEEQIEKENEEDQQQKVEQFQNMQQQILQDAQNKQQEMLQNGTSSQQQQQMLQDVQSMQQQMLQMMQ